MLKQVLVSPKEYGNDKAVAASEYNAVITLMSGKQIRVSGNAYTYKDALVNLYENNQSTFEEASVKSLLLELS
ncbi:hypothetical protein [Ligilactobacillus agilis]|uniref:hypothetical protein n=1 Tax=Ligilactobacillus agilis TaxID=1601 RepID=UPI000B8D88FC|nr:hypothetical protein [Ligilactobacillus agilis]ASR40886.1 hypothetical protein BEN83_05030 [Ligilactobacillus agilis]